jgi:hypothetical protein
MRITKDEENVMRAILKDAYKQVKECDRQWSKYIVAYLLSHPGVTAENSSEPAAKSHDFSAKRTKIYEDAVAKLKHNLGEETFNKVDTWVDQNEYISRTPGTSKPRRPEDGSDSEQAPKVQQ